MTDIKGKTKNITNSDNFEPPNIGAKSTSKDYFPPHDNCAAHSFCKKVVMANDDNIRGNLTYLNPYDENLEHIDGDRGGVIKEFDTLPPPKDKNVFPVSVETVDDWFAQSINRSYISMANPKKAYNLPVSIQQSIKKSFGIKNKDLNDENKDATNVQQIKERNNILNESLNQEFGRQTNQSKKGDAANISSHGVDNNRNESFQTGNVSNTTSENANYNNASYRFMLDMNLNPGEQIPYHNNSLQPTHFPEGRNIKSYVAEMKATDQLKHKVEQDRIERLGHNFDTTDFSYDIKKRQGSSNKRTNQKETSPNNNGKPYNNNACPSINKSSLKKPDVKAHSVDPNLNASID